MTTTEPAAVRRFTDRAEAFAATLDKAQGRWDAPTPCEGWAVRDVVDHVVTTERDFLVRQGLLEAGPGAGAGTDPAEAFRAHLATVTGVLAADGVAERAYDGYFGPTTVGETLSDFYGWDLVVHAWDVAAATDQPRAISDDAAADLSATADGWGDALHSEGICAAPVPVADDAPAGERLLARLGRDPHWRP